MMGRARATYADPSVVAFFSLSQTLQASEKYLFSKWIPPRAAILDIGVGAGRTSAALSGAAARYVGVDYSRPMVIACRQRFPELDIRYGDAKNLSDFSDSEFDIAVFSFNGIDYFEQHSERSRCLREVARVLKPNGRFILSSHHSRVLINLPELSNCSVARGAWRIAYCIYKSIRAAFQAITSRAFWDGTGYFVDPVHGGLTTFATTPQNMAFELEDNGFTILEIVTGPKPGLPALAARWYYFACAKSEGDKHDKTL